MKNKGLLVLLSVAGSQNLPQVDLILYLPNNYPDILEKIKKSLFNTHKKDLRTVVHLKRIKNEICTLTSVRKKRKDHNVSISLEI